MPDAEGAAVTGRFARVHWRAVADAAPAPARAPATAPGPADADPLDPATLPPFSITVEALKFNDATLGQAVLRTRPLANGLRIEQLQAETQYSQ